MEVWKIVPDFHDIRCAHGHNELQLQLQPMGTTNFMEVNDKRCNCTQHFSERSSLAGLQSALVVIHDSHFFFNEQCSTYSRPSLQCFMPVKLFKIRCNAGMT